MVCRDPRTEGGTQQPELTTLLHGEAKGIRKVACQHVGGNKAIHHEWFTPLFSPALHGNAHAPYHPVAHFHLGVVQLLLKRSVYSHGSPRDSAGLWQRGIALRGICCPCNNTSTQGRDNNLLTHGLGQLMAFGQMYGDRCNACLRTLQV